MSGMALIVFKIMDLIKIIVSISILITLMAIEKDHISSH